MKIRRKSDYKDNICQECGRPYTDWNAPRAIWWAVIGQFNGMICASCFLEKLYLKLPNTRVMTIITPSYKNGDAWKIYNKNYGFPKKRIRGVKISPKDGAKPRKYEKQ